MRRLLAAMLAWFMLALAIAHAVPARPLYEPPEPPKPTSLPDLRDTAWQGVEQADRNIYFHPDGQLSYARGQAGFGSWRLEGNNVYFEFNKQYREFRGTINGNTIQGDSWNIGGKRWVTSLQRVPMTK